MGLNKMSKYKVTLFPYEYAILEQEGKSIRLDFNQSREEVEELLCTFIQQCTFDVPYYEAYDDCYYAIAKCDCCIFRFYYTKNNNQLVTMTFIRIGDDSKNLEVFYNNVQLIGKQLKQVMHELTPFQLKYYVGDPHQYLTSSGLGIYIDNQVYIPGVDDKDDDSCDSVEHLLHCPVCGADIESDYFDKSLKETGVPQKTSSWCVFDTTKNSWSDCRDTEL